MRIGIATILVSVVGLVLPLGVPASALRTARAQDGDAEPELTPATRTAAELMRTADDALRARRWDDAISGYRKLLEHLEKKKAELTDFPEAQQKNVRVHAHYNAACALALSGKRAEALGEVKAAIDAGFFDWQALEKDEDLASVRGESLWKELVASLRGQDKEARKLAQFVNEAVSAKPLFDFDFELTTLDKEAIKLSDWKGKVVIVDCFGTWCPPCKEEIPSFVRLVQEAREHGDPVVVVGLCWERAEPTAAIEKDVRDFVADKKIPYHVVLMKEKDPVLDRIPELRAFPTTIWIDKQGKVRAREEGLRTFEQIDGVTKRLLAEGAPRKADAPPGEKSAPAPDKKPAPRTDEPF